MSTTNFQDDANWFIIRASIAAKQRLSKCSEEYNLSIMQALTICLMQPDKSIPMSELSTLLACDRSNVTGIVERLSIGKYIQRRESSADRRVKTIKLTEDGANLRSKLLSKVSEEDAPNLKGLSHEEIEDLKQLLNKAIPNLVAPKLEAMNGFSGH
jgi:DNA-binding MarR family transcriptional regulator